MVGRRDNDYGRRDDDSRGDRGRGEQGPGTLGGGGFGTGWGNQEGRSWNRERPGERGWYGADAQGGRGGGDGRSYEQGEREGWFSDSEGGERGRRRGGGGGRGGYASRALSGEAAPAHEQAGRGAAHASGPDPHYSEWRRRQIEDLDRDYEEWRREHQSRFEQEFGSWRARRQAQRRSLSEVAEHMEVVGSDGSHVGTVDKVLGDRIILTKSDPGAGGVHHSVPSSWVEKVAGNVSLNRTADAARAEWRNETQGRALFENDAAAREGPGNLDRAFSGTYEDQRRRNSGESDGRD